MKEQQDQDRRQAIDDGWDQAKPKRWGRNKFSSERKRL